MLSRRPKAVGGKRYLIDVCSNCKRVLDGGWYPCRCVPEDFPDNRKTYNVYEVEVVRMLDPKR